MSGIICSNCRREKNIRELDYVCPICGGIFIYAKSLTVDFKPRDSNQPGIWRYRSSFGFPPDIPAISLGEGNTPLIWDEVNGKQVAFKLDYLNPTGSYKDRGTTVLISSLNWLGVDVAVEDSSGNAGASFAAYASRAGIHGRVYVPDYASGPKRAQIEAYGVELIRVPGPRSNAAKSVLKDANSGTVYASHVYQPAVMPGYATAAFEIFDQLGKEPGAVITPAGQGSFLLGMHMGFISLYEAGLISRIPQMVGVQAKACAPLWDALISTEISAGEITEGKTVAEGIRIKDPVRGEAVLEAVNTSGGTITAIEEQRIIAARDELAGRGFYVEPTSAVVWPALLELIEDLQDPIVIMLTGSGLKFDPSN